MLGSLEESLEREILALTDRCLYSEAQWILELYESGSNQNVSQGKAIISSRSPALIKAQNEFSLKQYRRVQETLRGDHCSLSLFLRFYAKFIATDLDTQNNQRADFVELRSSEEFPKILHEIDQTCQNMNSEPYLLTLAAKVYHRMGNIAYANELLLEAVKLNPWNWAAWDAIVVQSSDSLKSLWEKSVDCPLKNFFYLKALLWLHSDASQIIKVLLKDFPRFTFLASALARNAYNCREFERAVDLFGKLFKQDESRVDCAHVYSDALFILGRKAELCQLAAHCVKINRFCPETCCVLGNLWSLQGQHDKAAISFRRALRLDPEMQSAWVLVGHEFIELRNPSAAISCYLRATSNDLDLLPSF